MTYVVLEDAKGVGLRTALLEEQERALELLQTVLLVLQESLAAAAAVAATAEEVRGLLYKTAETLSPLLKHILSDSIKEKSIEAAAALLSLLALCPQHQELKRQLLLVLLNTSFASLAAAADDAEAAQTQASALAKAIEAAGSNVLNKQEVRCYILNIAVSLFFLSVSFTLCLLSPIFLFVYFIFCCLFAVFSFNCLLLISLSCPFCFFL